MYVDSLSNVLTQFYNPQQFIGFEKNLQYTNYYTKIGLSKDTYTLRQIQLQETQLTVFNSPLLYFLSKFNFSLYSIFEDNLIDYQSTSPAATQYGV